MRLKSLLVATLVAMLAILGVSFLAFQAISKRVQQSSIDPTFDRMDEFQLEEARAAYESGGKPGLLAYMDHLNHSFTGIHFLLDGNGVDVITGKNHANWLPPAPETKSRVQLQRHWRITHRSADGKYWFVAVGVLHRVHIWTFLPYYFLVIGAIAVLFWVAAAGVILPIGKIASTIAVFGTGDLSARVQTRRPDEIGQLGRSFNQMAERLERLILSERRLLGDISHELRSPLARLKFAIKLARTSSESKVALDRIERDVDRIAALVSDIVEITIVEGDPALRVAERVPVAEVIQEIVRDCSVEAEARRSRIELTGQMEGKALGSRELLRRAVENVLRNSIRYSPEDALIQVSMAQIGSHAVIEVRDHGPGVPEETLAHIFDPFFRVEEARDTNGGGSGLGLSIAKRAVQAHHGTITAENASPGLRVRMTIPLVTEALPTDESAHQAQPMSRA